MMFYFNTYVSGFGLSAALIIAIGAQNAFVLRQGLRRVHVFAVACVCTLCDIVLILLGVAGLGTIISRHEILAKVALWGGALFLVGYGLISFRSALHAGSLNIDENEERRTSSLKETVIATLAISLLNPHVYLDTIVLLGSIGGQYPVEERLSFTLGATSASIVWFFGLAYGAAWLAPLFQKPAAWRILDALIGIAMWAIAFSLIMHGLK